MTETRAPLLRREGRGRDGRPFLVRPTGDDDVPQLVALLDAVNAEGRWLAGRPGERSAVEEHLLLAGLHASGGLSLTLEVAGAVAGRVLVQRRRAPHEGHVGEVAIVIGAGYRGHGFGRALMGTAVAWARAVGVTRLELGVFPDNAPAIALYRGLGFVEEGLQRRRLRVAGEERDLLLMARLLDAD